MSTAGDPSPGQYRGRRRAPLGGHARLLVLAALALALSGAIAVRAFATGAPADPDPAAQEANAAPTTVEVPAGPAPGAQASTPHAPASTPGKNSAPGDAPVPAIPPAVSPVPEPSEPLVSYEAEALDVVRSPGVALRPLPTASGGQFVVAIRDGRSVRFPNVQVDGGGDFTLTVFFVSPDPRTTLLRINDGPAQPVPFPSSGGRDQVASLPIKIVLLVGINVIEFAGPPGALAPDLDRITVH